MLLNLLLIVCDVLVPSVSRVMKVSFILVRLKNVKSKELLAQIIQLKYLMSKNKFSVDVFVSG